MFTTISLIVLVISWYLFKNVSGSMKLTQLNMVSWIFYYRLVVQSFIASILVINGWSSAVEKVIISDDVKLYGWIAIQYTMIAMPLGMLCINYLCGYESNRKLFLSYVNSPMLPLTSKNDSFIKYPLYTLSLISIMAVVYTFISLKNIPLLVVFQGLDAYSLLSLRIEAAREFEGSDIVRYYLGILLTPILSYVAYAYWYLTKSREHLIWFLIMFLFSFFILTYDLSKAPFAAYVLCFLFLNVLIKGSVKKKTFLFFMGAVLISVITAYFLIMRLDNFQLLFMTILERIFLKQGQGTFYSFEYFPRIHDFIGFSSLAKDLQSAFGMDFSERAARIIMTINNPEGIRAGIVGVMNSLFIQEAWANFGLAGVIIAPIYVGMFVQVIYMSFLKSKKTPIALGILTYLSYKMPITGDFNEFILPYTLMFVLIIFISVYVTALLLKCFKRNMHENHISLSKHT